MTEKAVREWCEELGLSVEEMARRMDISTRALMKLEASGQTYPGFDEEWGVPVSEAYGLEKAFWYEPEKAVEEWKKAVEYLAAFADMATNTIGSEPLIAALGDAVTRARRELEGCRRLLADFERQEEQIRSETVPLDEREAEFRTGRSEA